MGLDKIMEKVREYAVQAETGQLRKQDHDYYDTRIRGMIVEMVADAATEVTLSASDAQIAAGTLRKIMPHITVIAAETGLLARERFETLLKAAKQHQEEAAPESPPDSRHGT